MKNLPIQQGDVMLEPVKIPTSAKKIKTLILRHGESGHKHELLLDKGEGYLMEEKGETYVRVTKGTVSLVHGEHGTIELPVGEFKLLPGVFEYDYDLEESKRVID